MPVQPAIRREPISPKPTWRGVFLEPAYPDLAEYQPDEEDDDEI